jgi:hypothetical protein
MNKHILVELRLGYGSSEDKVYNEGKYIHTGVLISP